ncbi:MAG: hypothetical protein V3V61_06235 [Gammaproteobacteria bacterium]
MALFRIIKSKSKFIIFNRTFLEDDSLNLAARGLLAWLLQHPNEARLDLSELIQQLPDAKKSIDRAIRVLQNANYILCAPTSADDAYKFSVSIEWRVYECPQSTFTPNEPCLSPLRLIEHDNKIDEIVKVPSHTAEQPIARLDKINDTLSLEQKKFIQQAAADLCEQHKNQASEAQWQQTLEKALLNKYYLARFHSNFFKKLKCLKEILSNSHMRALFWNFASANDSVQTKSPRLCDIATVKISLKH